MEFGDLILNSEPLLYRADSGFLIPKHFSNIRYSGLLGDRAFTPGCIFIYLGLDSEAHHLVCDAAGLALSDEGGRIMKTSYYVLQHCRVVSAIRASLG